MLATQPRQRPWTRDEYYKMGELGWFDGQRVQLIDGEIIEMTPQGYRHFAAIEAVADALREAFGRGYWVRTQGPLALSENAEPEPDVSVVKGHRKDYTSHPATALLVVEIADATLRLDISRKPGLYARYGIEDYWVLDITHDKLIVHRDPKPAPSSPSGFHYTDIHTLSPDESVAPLAASAALIRVADMLP